MTGEAPPVSSVAAGEPSAASTAATPPAAAATLLTTPPAAPAATTPPAATPPTEAAKPAATGAPEKYAEFALPEGTQVDAVALQSFAPVLKDLNLTQEQAQKLVDVYAAQNTRAATEFGTKLQDPKFAVEQAGLMLASHRDAWAAAVKADKDLGGAQFDANVQTAQRAMARFASPELKDLLNTTGLGNHPALLKLFVNVGKQIREDNPDYGASTSGRKPTIDVLYPSHAGAGA